MKLLGYLAPLFLAAACGNVKSDQPDPLDPTIPHVTASTDGTDAIHVEWTEADGATTYQVWRAEAADGPFESLVESDATAFDDVGLGASDVKFYRVIGCDSDGTCDAESELARGFTLPETVTLDRCSRGTVPGAIACSWQPATGEVDGDVRYELHAHVAGDAPAAIGVTPDVSGAGAVAPGQLYAVSVAVVNTETGAGPDSNELPGYAEGVVIVYEDTDPVDALRAEMLAQVLATDLTVVPGAAGTMPSLPAVLLPGSLVASTYAPDEAWAGRPMIVGAGFARTDDGTLRNLATASRSLIAMGPAVMMYDQVNAIGGSWGPGPSPAALDTYSEFGGYTDAVVNYADADVFTTPLYATGYGTAPLDRTAERYTDAPTSVFALYRDAPAAGFAGLCGIEASLVYWYGCAQQDGWGWLGYLDPPDTASGRVLLVNMVARLAAR